jgi:hypothetical protein
MGLDDRAHLVGEGAVGAGAGLRCLADDVNDLGFCGMESSACGIKHSDGVSWWVGFFPVVWCFDRGVGGQKKKMR